MKDLEDWMGIDAPRPRLYKLKCDTCGEAFETLSYAEIVDYGCPFCLEGTMEEV